MSRISAAATAKALWIPRARRFIRDTFGEELLGKEVRLTPTACLFAKDIRKKRLNIVHGGTGAGKTLCAALIIYDSMALGGRQGTYVSATDLSLLIGRGGYLTASKETAIEELKRTPWVVVDDLGAEVRSAHFEEIFFHLVDAWAGRRITGIFITNTDPSTAWPDRYGARTWSRIHGWSAGEVLRTADPDFRIKPELLETYPQAGVIGGSQSPEEA